MAYHALELGLDVIAQGGADIDVVSGKQQVHAILLDVGPRKALGLPCRHFTERRNAAAVTPETTSRAAGSPAAAAQLTWRGKNTSGFSPGCFFFRTTV